MSDDKSWVEQVEEQIILRQGMGGDNSILLTISPTNRVVVSGKQAGYIALFEMGGNLAQRLWGFKALQPGVFSQSCQELQLTMGVPKNSREQFVEAQKGSNTMQQMPGKENKGLSL